MRQQYGQLGGAGIASPAVGKWLVGHVGVKGANAVAVIAFLKESEPDRDFNNLSVAFESDSESI